MSASASLTALDGVTTANGVSVGTSAAETWGDPVAGRVLPTRTELAAVLPWPGLRRGSTVAIHGSAALLLALLSEATAAGSWAAVVGLPGLSMVAAAEAGADVSRLALVPRPGTKQVDVLAALLDGVDLVAVGEPGRLAESDARRLSTRARNRGSVLLPFATRSGDSPSENPWPGADVRLSCTGARWRGPDSGHGHLREREITVRAEGRGAAARPRSHRLLLPDRDGALSAAPVPEAPVSEAPVSDRPAPRSMAG